uniref:Pecanex-like protein n=1 Tax=Steinernema glaseri TaxID=37863 RepID=A0A1I7YS73_9BILA
MTIVITVGLRPGSNPGLPRGSRELYQCTTRTRKNGWTRRKPKPNVDVTPTAMACGHMSVRRSGNENANAEREPRATKTKRGNDSEIRVIGANGLIFWDHCYERKEKNARASRLNGETYGHKLGLSSKSSARRLESMLLTMLLDVKLNERLYPADNYESMHAFKLSISYVLFFFIFVQIDRKLKMSSRALVYLHENRQDASEESFEHSKDLERALQRIRSPAVILLNQASWEPYLGVVRAGRHEVWVDVIELDGPTALLVLMKTAQLPRG